MSSTPLTQKYNVAIERQGMSIGTPKLSTMVGVS